MGSSKKNLITALISVMLVFSLLVVSTAVYMSSGTPLLRSSSGDNFKVGLFWSENPLSDGWKNVDDSGNSVALSSAVKWEPGHSEVRYFKVSNAGNIDFTYEFGIDSDKDDDITDETIPLGDVIKVYVSQNAENPESSYTFAGTLNDCFLTPRLLTGELASDGEMVCVVRFLMDTDAGNEYQSTEDNRNSVGFRIWASATAPDPEPEFEGEFGVVLPNYESYLYRVGNKNNVSVSKLFYIQQSEASSHNNLFMINAFAADDIDSSKVDFSFNNITGNAACVFTADASDWSKGTLKFSGEGVLKITMLYDGVEKAELNVEVVTATNVISTSSSIPTTSSDIVLLENLTLSNNFTVNNHIIYGNGFAVTDNRSNTSQPTGFVNMYSGVLDNVEILGQEYPELVESGTTNQYYSPCVYLWSGKSKIYNSHIAGCRFACFIESDAVIEGTVFDGGTFGNVNISSGNVVMKNCVTTYTTRQGLKGLAVVISGVKAHLTLNGSFRQYNWIQKSELPSTYQTVMNSVYSNTTYAATLNKKTYINTGILCLSGGTAFSESLARAAITDNTGNNYGYIEQTTFGETATCYLAKAAECTEDRITLSGYSFIDQYPTLPKETADYTNLNYVEKTDGSNTYCYHDNATGAVNISYETSQPGFVWNPMILTVTKYGKTIPYTVTMNGNDYTNKTITFSQAGEYTVVYTYSDTDYYHGQNADKDTITYTRTEKIVVVAVDPAVTVKHPDFTFGSNSSVTKVINNNTYVMPALSAVADGYGSTTISGNTVYYPIVTVGATGSNGNTAYSSGKGYYYAPAFLSVNITDYNPDTGNTQYTYNSSSKNWPHGKGATAGPDSAVFGYAQGAAYGNQPYGRSLSAQYYSYATNNNGLCYVTNDIEKDNAASNHLVQYHYVGNDGITYYYYIRYDFQAMTYSQSCFAQGTYITLADGSYKPVESITPQDKVLSWNFFTGGFEEKDICLLLNHGKKEYNVLTTVYSDGTSLRTIGDHGVFDYDLNKFVFLNEYNYSDYIGHRFVRYNSDGSYGLVVLITGAVASEYTTAYSLTSANNVDVIADNMLTSPPPDDFYNWIPMKGKMRYDTEFLRTSIEKFGLYDYSEFSKYLTYNQFTAFNGPLLKVAVATGRLDYDYIFRLIEQYSQYFL